MNTISTKLDTIHLNPAAKYLLLVYYCCHDFKRAHAIKIKKALKKSRCHDWLLFNTEASKLVSKNETSHV